MVIWLRYTSICFVGILGIHGLGAVLALTSPPVSNSWRFAFDAIVMYVCGGFTFHRWAKRQ